MPRISHCLPLFMTSPISTRDELSHYLRYFFYIYLNAAAYQLHYLRWDVFHETSKGWISIQDTRPHVSGMQTRETLSHSKLCDFIFQKNLVSPCFLVLSGQETWIICKDWECSRETVTILHTRPHASGSWARDTMSISNLTSFHVWPAWPEFVFLFQLQLSITFPLNIIFNA